MGVHWDTEIRDTAGCALLPEARTAVLKASGSMVSHVVCASRFLMLMSENAVSIHPTDSPSGVLPDVNSGGLKKGSLPVLNERIDTPIATILVPSDVINAGLSHCEKFLFLFTCQGVHTVDLTADPLTVQGVSSIQGIIEAGSVCGKKLAFKTSDSGGPMICDWEETETGISTSGIEPMFTPTELKKFGSKSIWKISASGRGFGLTCEGKGAFLVRFPFGEMTKTMFPLGTGDVVGHAVVGHDAEMSLIVHQTEAVSIFRKDELLFQLRDAINKVKYESFDVRDEHMICVTQEPFTKKYHLELFDLSPLRVKAVALSPLLRWDISRLILGECSMRVKFVGSSLLSFVTTYSEDQECGAILWEPLVRDQWFSFMPNFKMLNRNEPYLETEEEFDFNQTADELTIRSSVNRYQSLPAPKFSFIPKDEADQVLKREGDVEMLESSNNSFPASPVVYQFLQPLSAWKIGEDCTDFNRQAIEGKSVEFFGQGSQEALTRAVSRAVRI